MRFAGACDLRPRLTFDTPRLRSGRRRFRHPAPGGKRRGAYTSSDGDRGKTDVIHEHFAIECKLFGAPSCSVLLGAAKQAEENARPGQEPVGIVKRKNARDEDALVVMRLATFRQWRL